VVVVERPSTGCPSISASSASKYATPHEIGLFSTAYSCIALICSSWVCHSDWQEQIVVVAADAVEPDALPEV
jgi:hypothetical protein